MKSVKKFPRLSPEQKLKIVQTIKNGKSVTDVSKKYGVSRTILYKWLKKYSSAGSKVSKKTLESRYDRGRKHWRKLDRDKKFEVLNLWRQNPDYSIRKIARITNISVGAAWKIVNTNTSKTKGTGKKVIRKARNRYKNIPDEQKITLIKRFEQGEKVSKLAREAGVSRTIFYKWIKKYKESGENTEALSRNYPKERDHWRFTRSLHELILQTVSEHPEYSIAKIRNEIVLDGKHVSRSGLYYMLRRLNLSTAEDRTTYALHHQQPFPVYNISHDTLGISRYLIYSFIMLFSCLLLSYSLMGNPVIERIKERDNTNFHRIVREDIWHSETPVRRMMQQDLSWGAFAVNTLKSIYEKGEKIQIGYGAVDSRGQTICSADIETDISSKDNSSANLNSEKEVQQSEECGLQTITNRPDYTSTISANLDNGTYNTSTKVSTYEGKREFLERLIIVDSVLFDIERSSYPTRIFPGGVYPVEITIKANKDFKGEIADTLPKELGASNVSNGGIVFNNKKDGLSIVKWDMNMKKGNVYKLSYNLRFADIYPAFYEIGPLSLFDKSTQQMVFSEARYWQIVADAL